MLCFKFFKSSPLLQWSSSTSPGGCPKTICMSEFLVLTHLDVVELILMRHDLGILLSPGTHKASLSFPFSPIPLTL